MISLLAPLNARRLTRDPIGYDGGIGLYIYCNGNPIVGVDPEGLDAIDNLANFFGGWGGTLTFGLTGAVAQKINNTLNGGDYRYDNNGILFKVGVGVGVVNGLAIDVAGSLNAGAKTVFYSGKGALDAARAGKGTGMLLENTVGGRDLNYFDKIVRAKQAARGVTETGLPDKVWRVSSAILAANAKGDVQAFLRSPTKKSVWITVEKPTLELMNRINGAVGASKTTIILRGCRERLDLVGIRMIWKNEHDLRTTRI